MPGPQYTKCFDYPSPGGPPFHETDFLGLGLKNGGIGLAFGVLTGLVVGFLVGGPIGAIVGLLVGAFSVGFTATAMAITEGANLWLYHRLVCLGGRKCAVGSIMDPPAISDLGEFDNDEFFDLALMPYAPERVKDIPADTIFDDGFQGGLLRPRADLLSELGYFEAEDAPRTHDRSKVAKKWLHCEAEGDFWVRMADLAAAMGLLGGAAAVVTAGGALAGAAAGCSWGGFFGPIGCIIGAIIGGIIGALVGAGGSKLVIDAVLEGIFETNPGDVDDANVGDEPLGPLVRGDKVVVFGEHVYDGLHEGWHEIHPLLAICKVASFKTTDGTEASFYLEWDPSFPKGSTPPSHQFDLALPELAEADMRAGLASDPFRKRATALRDRWCGLLSERFDEKVGQTQQGLDQRWTVHPAVDGCKPAASNGEFVPPH